VTNGRRAQVLAWLVGVVIFIESNITVLVAGAVSRPLFDRFRVSREKLAYIIDSTSAPICILIPLNAWGAYILGLLANPAWRPAGCVRRLDPAELLRARAPWC
jgi:tetracycline resistance efflux pump